jgi:hypothetical protein
LILQQTTELASAMVLGHIFRHAVAMPENFRSQAYVEHVRRLEQRIVCKDEAMRLAVGGEFDAVGKLEYYLLRSLGLSSGHLSSMSVAEAADWPGNWRVIRAFTMWELMSFRDCLSRPKR